MTEAAEQSLDDLLAGTEPEEVGATGEQEEAEPEAEQAEPETDKADPESEEAEPDKAEKAEDSTPESDDKEPENWTKAAVLDERRKRQELERKLAEFEKSNEDKPDRPDLFADPDGALEHVRAELREELQSTISNTRLEISQELMRDRHDDYDELETEFVDMAKDNPVLLKELNASPNPARYAYETARKAREAAELKDVDKMRAKMESEIRAEIEAKLKAEMEESSQKASKKREAVAPSLAASQSKGGVDDHQDDSLDAILSR